WGGGAGEAVFGSSDRG
ncbi:hypothetical protein V492_07044, partial [Pseudogymnoascus sp. VKM F-4246]